MNTNPYPDIDSQKNTFAENVIQYYIKKLRWAATIIERHYEVYANGVFLACLLIALLPIANFIWLFYALRFAYREDQKKTNRKNFMRMLVDPELLAEIKNEK